MKNVDVWTVSEVSFYFRNLKSLHNKKEKKMPR